MSQDITGKWSIRPTEQRMQDGATLPAFNVIDEAGNIVARVHPIGPGEFERVSRRARVMAAAPALARLLWKLVGEARAHGAIRDTTASEAEAELFAIVHEDPRREKAR